jgi:hypothetical protein
LTIFRKGRGRERERERTYGSCRNREYEFECVKIEKSLLGSHTSKTKGISCILPDIFGIAINSFHLHYCWNTLKCMPHTNLGKAEVFYHFLNNISLEKMDLNIRDSYSYIISLNKSK